MSKALDTISSKNISIGKFTLAKTGLVVDGDPTYDEWDDCGKFLRQAEKAVQFWIGDWLNYGDRMYGQMYSQAVDETDYEEKTLRNAKWVSSQVELSRRRDNLSFSHHVEVASLPPEKQDLWLDKAESDGLSVHAMRNAISHERFEMNPPMPLPLGKYAVIYADPPWQYSNSGFFESAESQYPTMPVEEIRKMPIRSLTEDTSVLFLWATNPLLEDALSVLCAWGFSYKTNIAWIKDRGRGKGWYLKSRHEIILIGTKENTPHPKFRPDSCFEADRGTVHSKKPEYTYELIEKMYPGKKIELFARNSRDGWDSWGNEV